MNFKEYSRKFSEKAITAGYSQDIINDCLSYAKPIIESGFPIIYNTSHLSALVGYNKKYLKRAVFRTEKFYRKFSVLKSNGKKRELSEPLPSLKEIQRWIQLNILYKKEVSRFAKSYIIGRGLNDHVKWHTQKKKVVTLDIQNFFGSINIDQVQEVFQEIGYSKILSNLLARLCTLSNSLPQGAPTSPVLSNMIFKPLDEKIFLFCKKKKIYYSRYADDMAFSGDFESDELIEVVESILLEYGLNLNCDKTRIMHRNEPQIICGVIVNEKTQVPKYERNSIRQSVYFIEKFGLNEHLKRIEEKRANYLLYLLGRINYVLIMNPKDEEFLRYKKLLIDLKNQ